jgi:putative ABC transport system permease protein
MIEDYFAIAWKNLKKRRLRAWLTMIGIFISVATIFTLISLSIGLQIAVEEQFRLLGGDKFFIQPKGQLGPPQAGASVVMTQKDIDVVNGVNGVKKTSGWVAGNAKIEYKDEERFFPVYGMDVEDIDLFIEVGSLEIEDGRNLEKGDNKKIVIGNHYKSKPIFEDPVKAGDDFIINDEKFEVKGIFSLVGNPEDDRTILIPVEDFKEIFDSGDRIDFIMVQIDAGEDINEVAENVERKLQKSRGVNDKTQDFTILTPEEVLEIFGVVLNIITGFLGGVAAISLVVGGIGITNTMYTSVVERTKEIGIMKAIGAQNKDILLIFLIESGLLGLVGGIIGVILGLGIAKTIEYIVVHQLDITLLQAATPVWLFGVCLAFAFLTGAVSGSVPAWQASKVNTVDALRYE